VDAHISETTGLRTCEVNWNGIEIYGHVEERGESCYITVTGSLSQVWPMLMKSKIDKKHQIRLVLNDLFRELMGRRIAAQRIHFECLETLDAPKGDQVSFRVSEFCGKHYAAN